MTTTITTSISNNKYQNEMLREQLFHFDDLFSSSMDSIPQIEYDDYLMSYSNLIKEETLSSSPEVNNSISHQYQQLSISIDQCQPQESSTNSPPIISSVTNLSCAVCGAPAHGYNFNQITCESCKAFFRRNALRQKPNQRCRFSGSCVINMRTRRQCTYCRLKKCFDVKMRKDWIRTEEEREIRQLQKLAKEQKKLNIFPNDQQPLVNLPLIVRKKKSLTTTIATINPIVSQKIFALNRELSDEDRILFNNINQAYDSETVQPAAVNIDEYLSSLSLTEFLSAQSKMHEGLIHFYKRIPQFQQLDLFDQTVLIKRNFIEIMHLYYLLRENFQPNRLVGICMSKWINKEFDQRMSRALGYFNRFTEHPLILKLALIVLLFSVNLSTPSGDNQWDNYVNKINVREYQDFYTTILWRYLNYVFGEREAIRAIGIIVLQTLHVQPLMNTMQKVIKRDLHHTPCDELMQSLFRLT